MKPERLTAKGAAIAHVNAVADELAKGPGAIDVDVMLQLAQVQATLALVDAVEANTKAHVDAWQMSQP